ncbi:uncharacterized protein LOC131433895 [Malaya genurostris]|uniref:uncharacterized protein LOC131433895 n=1 Tax=Malaya genurostris TaxID=325434 RepID=UPI0026F39D78|nr:uncharacterized protein LOC131433895 [Malaya genurostris]
MNKAKKIKKLLVRRNNIVGSAKLIKQFDANFVFDRDFPQLKFRIEKLDQLWEDFNEVQAEIELEEELEADVSPIRIAFETDFFQLKGSLAEKLDAVASTRSSPSHDTQPAQSTHIRLPELKIPEFNVQKFQYLKAVLKGEALRLVQSLTVSAANYTIAWDTLRKRYDNKNLQIKQHFSAMLSTTSIRKESATALSDLADEFDKHVSVLNKLEDSKDHWNSFLVELLSSKLDLVSQKEWESQLDNDGRPTYNDLITFIKKRSRILQSLTLSQSSQHVAKSDLKAESKPWHQVDDKVALPIEMAQCEQYSRSASVVESSPSVSCVIDQRHEVPRASGLASSSSGRHGNRSSSLVSSSESQGIPSRSALSSSQVTNCQTVIPMHSYFSKANKSVVFMLTAYVKVKDVNGQYMYARALLDCASEANFVTESLAQALRLKRSSANIDVYGISQSVKKVKQQIPIIVASQYFQRSM